MKEHLAIQINLLRKDFKLFVEKRLTPYGLSEGTYFFLIYIHNHENCSQKELSEQLCVDKAYTARVIANFLKLKLIEKRTDGQDGRSVCLKCTEAGNECFKRIKYCFDEYDELLKLGIDENEYEAVKKILNKILTIRSSGLECER